MFKNLRGLVEESKQKKPKLYSFKKKENTGEIHIFESRKSEQKCIVDRKSKCGSVDRDDCADLKLNCKDEDAARDKAADLGKAVCGRCVGTLHTT